MDLQELYTERLDKFTLESQAMQKRYNTYSFVRLAYFLTGFTITILLWQSMQGWVVLFIIGFIYSFYRFVTWHLKMQQQKIHLESLAKMNRDELAAVNHDYSHFDNGEIFMDTSHPYAIDLDIFGEHSFFQYCNRTKTTIGAQRLAKYLTVAASTKEIQLRQEAIAELQNELEWRQNLQALGMLTEDNAQHLQSLTTWLRQPPFVQNNPFLKAALYIVPVLFVAGSYLWLFHLPWYLAILFYLPAFYILKKTLDQVNETHNRTSKAEKILAHYARIIQHIETKSFQCEKLKSLRAEFVTDKKNASEYLSRLSYIISQLNVRYNVFVIILNVAALWDLHWVLRLENWKAAQKENLPKWFDALAEMEALQSWATVYFNNPDWVFPTIHKRNFLEGIELGHPLLQKSTRVCNDLKIPTDGHIKLVTGSNMAGKSTYLRTVGLNIVMAMAGAPACAKQFTLPKLQVFTSMRTQDALHESTSSFYAELKRLKTIIEAVESRNDAFFLLDEILKGTNSNDRHTGSKALIRQLIKSEGSGIIATHDLELGQLEAISDGAVENLCMEVEVENETLRFDYKIKKGVSQSFNATLLMKNMGIRIEEA